MMGRKCEQMYQRLNVEPGTFGQLHAFLERLQPANMMTRAKATNKLNLFLIVT